MDNSKTIACVTGGTGMVGQRIVLRLISDGYTVRVLSRGEGFSDSRVEHYRGGLEDESVLRNFVSCARMLFHCAAELNNEAQMWAVNVKGTERLLNEIKGTDIRYFCYLSSAGVVGRTNLKWVNEDSPCDPQNAYEKSKWAAEQLVAQGIEGCSVVILRPTDVISEDKPGALTLPLKSSYMDVLKVFVKGGECAHIVHADDVADVALYFSTRHFNSPQCFFVSCDHEPLNTFAGLWALYKSYIRKRTDGKVRKMPHLPLIIPYLARKIWRGTGNRGDVRYSSEKLLSEGFHYRLGVKEAVKIVALRNENTFC